VDEERAQGDNGENNLIGLPAPWTVRWRAPAASWAGTGAAGRCLTGGPAHAETGHALRCFLRPALWAEDLGAGAEYQLFETAGALVTL